MILPKLFRRSSFDLAIDLGTVNTLVYLRGEGVVINEPSVVALETTSGTPKVLSVGSEAKMMLGKTPAHIRTVRPLRDGVIADIDVAEQMIKHFIDKAHGGRSWGRLHPEIVICIPSSATPVERRAIITAATHAGASKVHLIQESMAAAIGAGLAVNAPSGAMVVDIGGGTTELAVLSLGGRAYSISARVGGDRMDEAIASSIRRRHNLVIGESTAERVKCRIGIAHAPNGDGETMSVKGRDLISGMPREIRVTQADIATVLAELVAQIVQTIMSALETIEPELAADLYDHGIVMTGGGSLLTGLDTVISNATGLPVSIAENPLLCVAIGAGHALEHAQYRGVLASS